MKMDELKKCPFCGAIPTVEPFTDEVYCENCGNTYKETPAKWNKRPVEDELRKVRGELLNENQELRAHVAALQAQVDELTAERDAMKEALRASEEEADYLRKARDEVRSDVENARTEAGIWKEALLGLFHDLAVWAHKTAGQTLPVELSDAVNTAEETLAKIKRPLPAAPEGGE